jgi:hypothetical protein
MEKEKGKVGGKRINRKIKTIARNRWNDGGEKRGKVGEQEKGKFGKVK